MKAKLVKESLNEAAKMKWYIGKRVNPQLSNPYFRAYGQLTKAQAKQKEDTLYGEMYVTAYDTEAEYLEVLDKLSRDGYNIR